ncbi:hypothetical protein QSJ18_10710 [Gordonia sp. ABSL1-1]|uniref:hypothetical protein n=1 Tax=Gordonia sp. ABSL1-1 TaxID=3053923 RepID=UPI0025737E56|nr:hypothetical protein [Gordonia sp. ABSL1-1]MDL9937214.1 hypothetical protein [Gordonia sp. ABSL1-1]
MTAPTVVWTDATTPTIPSDMTAVHGLDEALAVGGGCVVVIPGDTGPIDSAVVTLLEKGFDVVTTGTLTSSDDTLEQACARGGSTLHHTGPHHFALELIATTMLQGPASVSHVRFVEAYRGAALHDDRRHRAGVRAIAEAVFGDDATGIETTVDAEPNGRLTVHGRRRGVEFFRHEILASSRPPTAQGEHLPFGNFSGAVCYTLQVVADPGDLDMQWELDHDDVALTAKIAFDAVAATRAAPPGILVADPRPRYRYDDRLPA